MPTVAV